MIEKVLNSAEIQSEPSKNRHKRISSSFRGEYTGRCVPLDIIEQVDNNSEENQKIVLLAKAGLRLLEASLAYLIVGFMLA